MSQPAPKKGTANKPRQPHESLSLQEMIEHLKHTDYTGRDFSQSLRRLDKLIQVTSRQDSHMLNQFVVQQILNFCHQYTLRKLSVVQRDIEYNEFKSRGKGGGPQSATGQFAEVLPKLMELSEHISQIHLHLATADQKYASRKKKDLEIQLLQHKLDQMRSQVPPSAAGEEQSFCNQVQQLSPELEAELAREELPGHLSLEQFIARVPMPKVDWHNNSYEDDDCAAMGNPPLKNAASA